MPTAWLIVVSLNSSSIQFRIAEWTSRKLTFFIRQDNGTIPDRLSWSYITNSVFYVHVDENIDKVAHIYYLFIVN